MSGPEGNKVLIRRLVDEVVNERDPTAIDELAESQFAETARRWIGPFRDAFPVAGRERIGTDRYEFQMLYGVRRDLQTRLRRAGHNMRVYIPFGTQWYPYLMRRLAERPANIAFVLGNMLKETVPGR